MKIVSWNVNSLKVRLPAVLEWMQAFKPDVVALQETKLTDEAFPINAFTEVGYYAHFSGQKAYNGVALLVRDEPAAQIVTDIPAFVDEQRRILAATWKDYRIINVYVPNGSELSSDKYVYKLAWLTAFEKFLQKELAHYEKVIVLGDFNIAPADIDVHDPNIWQNCVLVSEPERQALQNLLKTGLKDLYRELKPEGKDFTWWDYRHAAFRRNRGLRIDLILVTNALAKAAKDFWIDKTPRADERPSDHVPVVAEF